MQPIKRTRTPKSESAPSENVNQMPQDQNQYNSILEMVSKLQSDLEQQKSENAQMKREIASAK